MREATPAGDGEDEDDRSLSPVQSYLSPASSGTASQPTESMQEEQGTTETPQRDSIAAPRKYSSDSEVIPIPPVHQFGAFPPNIYDSDASDGRYGSRVHSFLIHSCFRRAAKPTNTLSLLLYRHEPTASCSTIPERPSLRHTIHSSSPTAIMIDFRVSIVWPVPDPFK